MQVPRRIKALPALRASCVWPGRSFDAEQIPWPGTTSGQESEYRSFFSAHAHAETVSTALPSMNTNSPSPGLGTGCTSSSFAQSGLQVVLFGEQHHQPSVLAAQMAALRAFVHVVRTQVDSSSGKPSNLRPIRLVLEHFSLMDQHLLTRYAEHDISGEELIEEYARTSHEGFRIRHYLPLLTLARDLGVNLVAGFPPRTWAQALFRQGLAPVQDAEQQRVRQPGQSVPLFHAWDQVTNVSHAQATYLRSLTEPDRPPTFPSLPPPSSMPASSVPPSKDGAELDAGQTHGHVGEGGPELDPERDSWPTERLPPPAPHPRGFEAAQALKDAYLAHTIASHLRCKAGNPAPAVFAVTGLGHAEYGQGAVERLVQNLQGSSCASQASRIPCMARPLILLSKPDDAGLWLGTPAERRTPAGAPTDTDPWARAAGDSVVLYTWQD